MAGKRKFKEKAAAQRAAPTPAKEDEEDFPRGGKNTLTPAEIREVRAEAEAEFEREQKAAKKRKKDNVFGGSGFAMSGNVPDVVEPLKFKKLSRGMRILGVVSEINKTDISISLPNGLHGYVKAEETSPRCMGEELFQNGKRNKEKTRNVLKELFQVGQLVACVVLSIQEEGDDEKQSKRAILSLLPKHFNEGLTIETVYVGQLMVASVKSVEDHGYILSFGLSNISGFLLNKDRAGDKKLQPGEILQGYVSSIDSNRGVVNLSTKNEVEHDKLGLGSLLPGLVVTAKVQAVLRNGLLVSFLTYFTGTVDIFHLETEFPNKEWAENYTKGKRLKGRILFVDMTSKSIRLSLRSHLLLSNVYAPPVSVGDTFQDAVIKRVDPAAGLLVELPAEPSHVPGYVNHSHVSDETIEKLEKKFREGQKVKARVIGYRLLDKLAAVSLKESVLKGVLNKSNLKAGMLVHGAVTRVESFGAFVSLGGTIKALCPLQHMSEYNRLKPSSKFKVGAKLKFRILQYDLHKKGLTVTHKKTLVSSKLPQLTSYDDAVEGLVTHGWIQGIQPSIGCFVEFYNHVKGLAHKSELGIDSSTPIDSVFQVGQAVKCRVLDSDPTNQKLRLSFVLSPRFERNDVKIGSIVSGVVTEIRDHELVLRVTSSTGNLVGTLSLQHLSDTPVHAEQMKPLLKPGYTFDRMLVLDYHGPKLILTAKYSLVQAADSLPSSVTQLASQAVIPGFISDIHENACVVRFLGQLTGIVPKRHAADTFVEDLSKVFQVGQSVRSQVLEVDLESGKVVLNLKQSACFSTDVSLIEGFFLEEEKIAELKDASGVEWAKSLPIGHVVEADVQEIKDYGIILNVRDNADVVGFAPHYQSDRAVEVGASVKAFVLDVVKTEGIVDLSLQQKMLKGFSSKNIKKALKVYQKVQVVVELVKDEYLVLSLPDYENAIGYASTRDFNIRRLRPHDFYVPGQRFLATIYNLESAGGRLLLLLTDAFTPKALPAKNRGNYEIGSVVEAQILEISPLHMTLGFGASLRGNVHISEVADDYDEGSPFKKYEIGQTVRAKVLSKQKNSKGNQKGVTMELSLRPSEIAGFQHVRSIITFETLSAGQTAIGYVQEVTEEWAWILLAPRVRGRLSVFNSSDDPSELERFKQRFKVGDAVRCQIISVNHEKKTIDLSIRPAKEDISKGDIVPGRIKQVHPGVGGLHVQVGTNLFGKIHVTHLGDVWMDNPADLFTEGKFLRCRVLEVKKNPNGKPALELSVRPSLGGCGGFESLPDIGNRHASRICDSLNDIKSDMEVQGFVKSVTDRGCFLTLAPHIDARILLKNLSDSYIENIAETFPIGKVITGRVLTVEPLSGRVEMALASLKAIENKSLRNFHIGDIVPGIIRRVESWGVFVNLADSDIVGLCHVSEVSDEFIKDLGAVYTIGRRVHVKILKVDPETKRISLGMKASYMETALADDHLSESDSDTQEKKSSSTATEYMEIDKGVATDEGSSPVVPDPVDPLEVDFEEDMEDKMVTDDEIPTVEEKKKQSKKEKRRLKEQREAAVRAAEERLLQNDQPPESVDDFERLVRSSPNSSYVWIKYMAFWLRLADVDKARAVAERALETINYREEGEKLNIWTAYLNLENSYATSPKEAVSALFERGLKFCDPKKLYLALLGIYEKSELDDMVEALVKAMTRKFRTSTKVWLRHITNLLSRGLQDRARKAFDQALIGLPRHKHIKFISRSAVLEFKLGSAERARDIFDGVLRNYPKRTDLWSVYIDQEIRLSDANVIRDLFERATCLDLPPKKMKFLFKKYLEYEKAQGDESRIEHVKTKAMEYVETKAG